jgi:hypothetical protein
MSSRWERAALICLILLACLFSSTSYSKGVSPYLPMNMSPEAERQIERLLALAGDPVLTRPIPASRVQAAVKKYCKKTTQICKQVRTYLERFSQSDGFTYANFETGAKSDDEISLPNQRGEGSANAFSVNAQLYLRLNPYWYAFLGGERREDGESLEGTYQSIGVEWMQLDFGYRAHWLSPMQTSAMLWSTNAETTPSITLSSPSPISDFGFRYELFATRLSNSDNIAFQGGKTSGSPCAIGMHLSMTPLPFWAIGLNRVMLYGGGARGECHKPKDLFKALFDPSAADNAGSNLSKDDEFGNQSASLTSRLNVTGRVPWSLYLEYAGEDTSVNKAYRLGNAALQVGLFFPAIGEDMDLTLEFSEWQNSWYVHHIYQDGTRNDGNVLGHWAADQRAKSDGVGGQAAVLRWNWQFLGNHLAHLQLRSVEQESYSAANYTSGYDVTARYSVGMGDYITGVEGTMGRSVWDEDFYRAGFFLRW